MGNQEFKPYVPAETSMREFSIRALILGVIMACVLGAANAYVGLKAGMTIAATFPAAVVAMAFFRIWRGSILEENLARTTASVGEALVAGAIFTIPAFVIAGIWEGLNYWEGTMIMLIGGLLGVFFVIMLRRTLVVEADLPFPESVAASEIHKAGQHGETGAKFLFGAMGISALIELLKNSNGITIFKEYVTQWLPFKASKIQFIRDGSPFGEAMNFKGGMAVQSPVASPAIMGVGYIIGPRLASIVFSGGIFAWLLLIPLVIFMNGVEGPIASMVNLKDLAGLSLVQRWMHVATASWLAIVRPIAVGAMLVGAFYTLYNIRKNLTAGIGKAIADMRSMKRTGEKPSRLQFDIPFTWVIAAIVILVIPITVLYNYFAQNFWGALIAALVMVLAGFLFAAVAGYLVGLIGSSNNPISGLTLSTLIVAALLMVLLGVTGKPGIAAVLGVAGVVCCATGIAGDMIQDLKVGHILGGTPWRMQVGEILGVIVASFVLIIPISVLHDASLISGTGGIGGTELPAPQAGLMAMLAKGIVLGEMAWPLVLAGMAFSVGLILIKSPSPMLIAVGMYLPFKTTAAIFVGGIIKWIAEKIIHKRAGDEEQKNRGSNIGILVASGLIAGEALTGVILAFLVILQVKLPSIAESGWASLIIFALVFYMLISIPVRNLRKKMAEPGEI